MDLYIYKIQKIWLLKKVKSKGKIQCFKDIQHGFLPIGIESKWFLPVYVISITTCWLDALHRWASGHRHTLIKSIIVAYTTIIKATNYSHTQSLKELLELGAEGPCTAGYGSSAYKVYLNPRLFETLSEIHTWKQN